MKMFRRDTRGSATQWFALAAFVVCAASLAGAHGLAWLSESGRVSIVAVRSAPAALHTARSPSGPDVDDTPTGAIPPATALMIRIR